MGRLFGVCESYRAVELTQVILAWTLEGRLFITNITILTDFAALFWWLLLFNESSTKAQLWVLLEPDL